MNRLYRIATSGAGAVMVTTGLGLIMVGLIKVTFIAPQERPETLNFSINAVIVEPPPIEIKPPILEHVTPPPPAPKLRTEPTDSVVVDQPYFDDLIPKIPPPVIKITAATARLDQTPTPIVRIAPAMPLRAERSGSCEVQFDISAKGTPYNIQTLYCSQSLFARPSIKSVQGWKYRPEVRNGRAVSHKGIRTNIIFELRDERGNLIPE